MPNYSDQWLKRRLKFSYSFLSSLPRECGVYAFWHNSRCVYVGKAEDQTIKERLFQHWAHPHNDILDNYLKMCRGDMRFSYILYPRDQVDQAERFYVKKLQPFANKRLK